MKRAAFAHLVVAAALAAPTAARAQVVGETPTVKFPDARRFARGPFAEGDVGAMLYLGRLGQFAEPGPAFAIRLGYDLQRWLAVQAYAGATMSSASAPPPFLGQSFQTYWYGLEGRLQLQLRRVGLYLAGGAGGLNLSSNLFGVDRRDPSGADFNVTFVRRFTFIALAGAGIDLHTLNRHFSVGLAADYMWLAQFSSSHALSLAAYLRYTM